MAGGLLLFIGEHMAVDVPALNAQIDASLTVMADAVSALKDSVAAIATAQGQGDAEAVTAGLARLKAGTDTLASAVSSARIALNP